MILYLLETFSLGVLNTTHAHLFRLRRHGRGLGVIQPKAEPVAALAPLYFSKEFINLSTVSFVV